MIKENRMKIRYMYAWLGWYIDTAERGKKK